MNEMAVKVARARGHLDEGCEAVFAPGLFEVLDHLDLGGPEALFLQPRHGLHRSRKVAPRFTTETWAINSN